MAASDYVPIFFKNRLHLLGRPQMGSRPSRRDQVATAMEMGRNNGCFGTRPLRQAARVDLTGVEMSTSDSIQKQFVVTVIV